MENMSSFKKSVLSIVFMSAVTGSFISWDKYQPRHETQSLVEFYEDRDLAKHFVFLEGIDNSNKNAILMAEEKRLIEAELMAQRLAENIYTREADEIYLHNSTQESNNITPVEPLMTDTATEVLIENEIDELSSKAAISEQILFAFDSSEVADNYIPLLNKTALIMQHEQHDDSKIWQVVGYADFTGNNLYNNKLAYKRAQSVTEYLVNQGVQEDKLIIVSLGESQSKQPEYIEENKHLARRVEIHDYDNLVATLSENFNHQMKEEMANLNKESLQPLKTQQTTYQLTSSKVNEVNANKEQVMTSQTNKSIIEPKLENKFEFSKQQNNSMATVMKL